MKYKTKKERVKKLAKTAVKKAVKKAAKTTVKKGAVLFKNFILFLMSLMPVYMQIAVIAVVILVLLISASMLSLNLINTASVINNGNNTVISNGTSTVLPSIDNGSMFYFPVQHAILSSKYGPRIHPVTGIRTFHSGVDLAIVGIEQEYVYPSRPGVVVRVAVYPSQFLPQTPHSPDLLAAKYPGGQLVEIKHSVNGKEVYTVYMHLFRVLVKEGQEIDMGTPLGIAGNTGVSTGTHVHFEVRLTESGNTVNPLNFLYTGGKILKEGDSVSEYFSYRNK